MVLTSSSLEAQEWHEDQAFEPLAYEKVIGLSNLLSIAWLSRGLEIGAAVARVAVAAGPGSSFLIAPDLLMTNHHVLPDAGTAAEATAEFNYQMDWAGHLAPVRRFRLDASHFHTNEELDYTIVRVQDSPGDIYGYIDLSARTTPRVNDYVSIIQHPQGGPKRVCLTDNKVAAVFGNVVQYSTDTEPGSSGSPVFDQSWQLVGLHHRGGGLAGPDGKKYFINQGMLMSVIVRDAAGFLGLPDQLYDLAFTDLRGVLVNLVDRTDPPSDPDAVAVQLLRTSTRFAVAVEDWCNLHAGPEDDVVAVAASGGVAIGAALRQWARSEGHEAIRAATVPKPPPSPQLVDLLSRYNGSSVTPIEVHQAVLAALETDRGLAEPIVGLLGEGAQTVRLAQAFLWGTLYGAAAYGG